MRRGKHGDCDFGEVNLSYFLKYLVARPFPIVVIIPLFTIFPKTASTVVGLISGKSLQIKTSYVHIKTENICRKRITFCGNVLSAVRSLRYSSRQDSLYSTNWDSDISFLHPKQPSHLPKTYQNHSCSLHLESHDIFQTHFQQTLLQFRVLLYLFPVRFQHR